MTLLAALIRSAPYGSLEATEGVRHLAGRQVLGFEEAVGLFCDDGAVALRAGQRAPEAFTSLEQPLTDLAAAGVRLIAERASLAERSLDEAALLPGVEVVDSVELWLLEADVVLVF